MYLSSQNSSLVNSYFLHSFQFVLVLSYSTIGKVATAQEIEKKSYIIFAVLFAIDTLAFLILVAVSVSV